MPFENAFRAVRVRGGDTVTGVARLYGGHIVAAGAAVAVLKVKKTDIDGDIIFTVAAPLSSAGESCRNKPVVTEECDLFIEIGAGSASETEIYVNHYLTISSPSRNLVCQITGLNYTTTSLISTITVVAL